MYSLLIACTFVALCSAATRPNIPESFEAITEVEVHRGSTVEFGKGYFCTDTPGEKDVRNDTLNSSPGSEQKGYFFQLQNFQEHEEYHIRPDGGREECSNEHLRGEYRPPFEWVKTAQYNGSETIEHRTLDVWFTRVSTMEIAVGVDIDEPNVPVVLMERSVGEERIVVFKNFKPGTPPTTYFDIPRQCRQPQ